MVEEEAEVWDSLEQAGYRYVTFTSSDADDAPRPWDFTPAAELYATYLRYRRAKRRNVDEDLTPQQFGVAFNAVTENSLFKARRWINIDGKRKKAWGYIGVRGPKSQRVKMRPGRPHGS